MKNIAVSGIAQTKNISHMLCSLFESIKE